MKKILTVLAIVLFTISANAQEAKTVSKEDKKCCAKHDPSAKMMTQAEITTCMAKCKAEGKVCTAEKMAQCTNDSHAKMTAAEIAECKAKCKAEGKVCKAEDMSKCPMKAEKACCAKKA